MPYLFSLLVLAAMIFALVDIITREEWQVKSMPKWAWVLLVVLLPLIGSALWFGLGREYSGGGRSARPRERPAARDAAPPPPAPGARSTEQQLADLEREIEQERLRAELARRAARKDQPSAGDGSAR